MKELIGWFTKNILLELLIVMFSGILDSCFCSKPKDVKIENYNVTIYADKGWQITPGVVEDQAEVILAVE